MLILVCGRLRTGTLDTPMKKYDLMNQVNGRGTFLCSRAALPYLLKSKNPHILNISPPLNLNPKWFKNNVGKFQRSSIKKRLQSSFYDCCFRGIQAYTMAKYGMSFCVLGMSEEFREEGVAVNALWPKTAIATDAIDFISSPAMRKQSRTVDIMADAAYQILIKDSKTFSGNFVIDEDILKKELNLTNLDKYAVEPGNPLLMDFFLDDDEPTGANLGSKVTPPPKKEAAPAASGSADVAKSMDAIKKLLSADLVKKIDGVYSFNVSDATPSEWYLDLKNGSGDLASGNRTLIS